MPFLISGKRRIRRMYPTLDKLLHIFGLQIESSYICKQVTKFPVWPRNQLISAGLERVLSHTEKSCFVSYYISMNIKNTIITLKPVLLARSFGIFGGNKTGFNLKIVHFLSVESCL